MATPARCHANARARRAAAQVEGTLRAEVASVSQTVDSRQRQVLAETRRALERGEADRRRTANDLAACVERRPRLRLRLSPAPHGAAPHCAAPRAAPHCAAPRAALYAGLSSSSIHEKCETRRIVLMRS